MAARAKKSRRKSGSKAASKRSTSKRGGGRAASAKRSGKKARPAKRSATKKAAAKRPTIKKSAAKRPAKKSSAKSGGQKAPRRSPIARVTRVAKEVAQQASTAVTEGIETVKEFGESMMDRVTG